MSPRTILRIAAANALASAVGLISTYPDLAPLNGAKVILGQTWPSQSPPPGAGPLPNQLLIYVIDDTSESISGDATAPQFATVATLVVEARVETNNPAAHAVLPATPTTNAISVAIDGRLDALTHAVREATCMGIQAAAYAVNGAPMIQGIRKIEVQPKLSFDGAQRIAGTDVVTFDLAFTETFNPLNSTAPLTDLSILLDAQAGGAANEGNTGTGTISAVTIGLGAQAGFYPVSFTSATAFTVTKPDTTSAGTGTVGAAFTGGGITFLITAGSHAFIAGDRFTVAVMPAAQTETDLSA